MSKKEPTTKKRVRRVETKSFDLEKRTLSMAFTNGEALVCPLMGLKADVLFQLASIGVVELLSRAPKKAEAWAGIQSGEAFEPKRKSYPLIVKALASLIDQATGEAISLHEAEQKYERLSAEEKRALRYDPHVRAKMAMLSLDAERASETWMDIVLGETKEEAAEAA